MIIGLEGFGSVWSTRRGASREKTAFYNTTGIPVDGTLRHRSRYFGQLRFNAIGGFNPHHIEANIGRVFHAGRLPSGDHPCLLLHHVVSPPQLPDYYLFRVEPDCTGVLEIGSSSWRSDGVILVSLSEFRERQEALLLMPMHGWIRTLGGRFVAEPALECPWRASFERKE